MLDPAELRSLANDLATQGSPSASHAVPLRRAVSTAYYALFHAILRRAADDFVGSDRRHSASYALVYRSFAHQRMKDVCEGINKARLKSAYQDHLKRVTVGDPMRFMATAFIELQEARHGADYDPQFLVEHSDARRACGLATFGIRMLATADPDEVRDVLALMMVTGRR